MAKVQLVDTTRLSPEQIASNAGRVCYESGLPEITKEKIDVRKRLFDTGHHTTWEHKNFVFAIDDISISTITFGLHLAHPFYNSDQRSGRFSKMYDNPDLSEIAARLRGFFPYSNSGAALEMIDYGLNVFQENKENLTDSAARQLRKERPNVSDKYIDNNAKKMAQEQLRVFVSTVLPTGMYHSLDLIALAALTRVAWTPEMKQCVGDMAAEVCAAYPEIEYVFEKPSDIGRHFINLQANPEIKSRPQLEIKNIDIPIDHIVKNPAEADSVDTLHFAPECMDNNLYGVRTWIEISTMTMGQDQRHRTLARGIPKIAGHFYLPPLLNDEKLKKNAAKMQKMFVALAKAQPELANFVVPYGAMVSYGKRQPLNGLLHEQAKRLCWCAQEEIYNLNIQLMQQLAAAGYGRLVDEMKPHCAKYGKCLEGPRYCGRDMSVWKNGNGFRQRGI